MSDFCEQTWHMMAARLPGIFIVSEEEERVVETLKEVVQKYGITSRCIVKEVVQYDKYRILRWSAASLVNYRPMFDKAKNEGFWKKKEFTSCSLSEVLNTFGDLEFTPEQEMAEEGRYSKEYLAEILILVDTESELIGDANQSTVRLLRETLTRLHGSTRTIIIVGNEFELPSTIGKDVRVIAYPKPGFAELKEVLKPLLQEYKKKYATMFFDTEQEEPFCRACMGLTCNTSANVLRLALVVNGCFDARAVDFALRERAAVVKRCSALEYRTPRCTLKDVAGMEHVKAWIHSIDRAWRERDLAKQRGVSIPSGLLLLGVSGCGKSLLCEALGGHWGLPLLQLHMGSLFGSLLGQSESNFRTLKQVVYACRPCIVFVDEIEKYIGSSEGEQDGGTSNRIKADFLSWMQDKDEEIFLVASANDIRKFARNPEIIRAGRFDAKFFVDLPGSGTRREVLRLKFRSRGQNPDGLELLEEIEAAVAMSEGYSPAELENCVKRVLLRAFNADVEVPQSGWLVEEIRREVPLSRTMAEALAALRGWCADGRAQLAETPVERKNNVPTKSSLPKL